MTSETTSERTRHVHVIVPERAYQLARAAAIFSGVPFKRYMARLMESARPEQFAIDADPLDQGSGESCDGDLSAACGPVMEDVGSDRSATNCPNGTPGGELSLDTPFAQLLEIVPEGERQVTARDEPKD